MSLNRSQFTTLSAMLLLAAAAPACAIDAGYDAPAEDDAEQSASALETAYGNDDIKSSTATQCSSQSPAVTGMKKICDSGLVGCTITPSCTSTSHSTELFTGTTQWPASSASPKSNGFGGRGRKMANAGLCLLRDLSKKKAVTGKAVKGPVSAQETIGFKHFDRAGRRVDAYRQTRLCVPVFGCIDTPAQEFNATIVQQKNNGSASPGDYPIDASYALKFEAHDLQQSVNIKLPAVQVVTPVGPVTITSEGGHNTRTNVVATIGNVNTPVYVENALQPQNPGYASSSTKALTDLLGRYPGLYYVNNPVAFNSTGWGSQIGMGSRAPNHPWSGPSSYSNLRPDLGTDAPRNTLESSPNANLFVSATLAYDPASLLPDVFKSTIISIKQARISVTPRFDTNAFSQFGVRFNEVNLNNLDVGSKPQSVTNLVMPSSVGINHAFSVTGRVQLDIDICPPIPFVGCRSLLDVDKKITVDAPTESAVATGTTGAVSMVRSDSTKFALKSTTMPSGYSLTTVDEGTYGYMRTFSGAGTTSNAETFVSQCFAQDVPDQPVPEPQYTPGNPEDDNGLFEFPCNICVMTEAIHVTNPYGQKYDRNSEMMSLLPSASNPLPSDKQWSCSFPYQANLGCVDVCTLNSATGKLVVKRSAVDVVSQACKANNVY